MLPAAPWTAEAREHAAYRCDHQHDDDAEMPCTKRPRAPTSIARDITHVQMMPTLTCALLPAFAPGLPQHRAREQPSCLASVGCIFLVAQPLSPLRSAIAATAFGGSRGQRSGDSGIGRGGPSVEEHRDKKNHVFFATTVPLQQSLCASLTCREIQVPYTGTAGLQTGFHSRPWMVCPGCGP